MSEEYENLKSISAKIIVELVKYYPGLLNGDDPVNGADLVDTLTSLIQNDTTLNTKKYLKIISEN